MPTPVTRGSTSLIEQADSNGLNYAERITYKQRFRGPYTSASAFGDLHYRGSTWTLTIPGIGSANFIVDACSVSRERGGIGLVEVEYCYLGTPPPDQWALTPFEVNPDVITNGFFADLTQAERELCLAYRQAGSVAQQSQFKNTATSMTHASLINSYFAKVAKGNTNFYLSGFKFQYTQHAFTPFTESVGGYIEAPSGPFASHIPSGFSWMRQADEHSWDNGIWKLTRTWLGGPDGYWDTDLYS